VDGVIYVHDPTFYKIDAPIAHAQSLGVERDNEVGQQLRNETVSHTVQLWTHDNTSECALCIAAISLGDYQQAGQLLQRALCVLTEQFQRSEAIYWLTMAAHMHAQESKQGRVVDALQLVRSQPEAFTG
jgi:hypothetical protein